MKISKKISKPILWFVLIAFFFNTIMTEPVQAEVLTLPAPTGLIPLSASYSPSMIRGLKVYKDNPFKFDFLVSKGDEASSGAKDESLYLQKMQLKEEANNLVKYFLAALTIPEEDMWVNLSPYEKDRMIPKEFGMTEMGKDLLAQDYLLKQVTASVMYPEGTVGKEFWSKIYKEAYERFGTTTVPVNTFNKVWIVPDTAVVFEDAKNNTAVIMEDHLKVMLESDYLAMSKHDVGAGLAPAQNNRATARVAPTDVNQIGSQIIREIILPLLEKEVNTGKNFATLRQVYHSLILASWFKGKLKQSLIAKGYVDRKKTNGVEVEDKQVNQKIYQQYLRSYKKGVYNYIKEEITPTNEVVPRKYFSGGMNWSMVSKVVERRSGENQAMLVVDLLKKSRIFVLTATVAASVLLASVANTSAADQLGTKLSKDTVAEEVGQTTLQNNLDAVSQAAFKITKVKFGQQSGESLAKEGALLRNGKVTNVKELSTTLLKKSDVIGLDLQKIGEMGKSKWKGVNKLIKGVNTGRIPVSHSVTAAGGPPPNSTFDFNAPGVTTSNLYQFNKPITFASPQVNPMVNLNGAINLYGIPVGPSKGLSFSVSNSFSEHAPATQAVPQVTKDLNPLAAETLNLDQLNKPLTLANKIVGMPFGTPNVQVVDLNKVVNLFGSTSFKTNSVKPGAGGPPPTVTLTNPSVTFPGVNAPVIQPPINFQAPVTPVAVVPGQMEDNMDIDSLELDKEIKKIEEKLKQEGIEKQKKKEELSKIEAQIKKASSAIEKEKLELRRAEAAGIDLSKVYKFGIPKVNPFQVPFKFNGKGAPSTITVQPNSIANAWIEFQEREIIKRTTVWNSIKKAGLPVTAGAAFNGNQPLIGKNLFNGPAVLSASLALPTEVDVARMIQGLTSSSTSLFGYFGAGIGIADWMLGIDAYVRTYDGLGQDKFFNQTADTLVGRVFHAFVFNAVKVRYVNDDTHEVVHKTIANMGLPTTLKAWVSQLGGNTGLFGKKTFSPLVKQQWVGELGENHDAFQQRADSNIDPNIWFMRVYKVLDPNQMIGSKKPLDPNTRFRINHFEGYSPVGSEKPIDDKLDYYAVMEFDFMGVFNVKTGKLTSPRPIQNLAFVNGSFIKLLAKQNTGKVPSKIVPNITVKENVLSLYDLEKEKVLNSGRKDGRFVIAGERSLVSGKIDSFIYSGSELTQFEGGMKDGKNIQFSPGPKLMSKGPVSIGKKLVDYTEKQITDTLDKWLALGGKTTKPSAEKILGRRGQTESLANEIERFILKADSKVLSPSVVLTKIKEEAERKLGLIIFTDGKVGHELPGVLNDLTHVKVISQIKDSKAIRKLDDGRYVLIVVNPETGELTFKLLDENTLLLISPNNSNEVAGIIVPSVNLMKVRVSALTGELKLIDLRKKGLEGEGVAINVSGIPRIVSSARGEGFIPAGQFWGGIHVGEKFGINYFDTTGDKVKGIITKNTMVSGDVTTGEIKEVLEIGITAKVKNFKIEKFKKAGTVFEVEDRRTIDDRTGFPKVDLYPSIESTEELNQLGVLSGADFVNLVLKGQAVQVPVEETEGATQLKRWVILKEAPQNKFESIFNLPSQEGAYKSLKDLNEKTVLARFWSDTPAKTVTEEAENPDLLTMRIPKDQVNQLAPLLKKNAVEILILDEKGATVGIEAPILDQGYEAWMMSELPEKLTTHALVILKDGKGAGYISKSDLKDPKKHKEIRIKASQVLIRNIDGKDVVRFYLNPDEHKSVVEVVGEEGSDLFKLKLDGEPNDLIGASEGHVVKRNVIEVEGMKVQVFDKYDAKHNTIVKTFGINQSGDSVALFYADPKLINGVEVSGTVAIGSLSAPVRNVYSYTMDSQGNYQIGSLAGRAIRTNDTIKGLGVEVFKDVSFIAEMRDLQGNVLGAYCINESGDEIARIDPLPEGGYLVQVDLGNKIGEVSRETYLTSKLGVAYEAKELVLSATIENDSLTLRDMKADLRGRLAGKFNENILSQMDKKLDGAIAKLSQALGIDPEGVTFSLSKVHNEADGTRYFIRMNNDPLSRVLVYITSDFNGDVIINYLFALDGRSKDVLNAIEFSAIGQVAKLTSDPGKVNGEELLKTLIPDSKLRDELNSKWNAFESFKLQKKHGFIRVKRDVWFDQNKTGQIDDPGALWLDSLVRYIGADHPFNLDFFKIEPGGIIRIMDYGHPIKREADRPYGVVHGELAYNPVIKRPIRQTVFQRANNNHEYVYKVPYEYIDGMAYPEGHSVIFYNYRSRVVGELNVPGENFLKTFGGVPIQVTRVPMHHEDILKAIQRGEPLPQQLYSTFVSRAKMINGKFWMVTQEKRESPTPMSGPVDRLYSGENLHPEAVVEDQSIREDVYNRTLLDKIKESPLGRGFRLFAGQSKDDLHEKLDELKKAPVIDIKTDALLVKGPVFKEGLRGMYHYFGAHLDIQFFKDHPVLDNVLSIGIGAIGALLGLISLPIILGSKAVRSVKKFFSRSTPINVHDAGISELKKAGLKEETAKKYLVIRTLNKNFVLGVKYKTEENRVKALRSYLGSFEYLTGDEVEEIVSAYTSKKLVFEDIDEDPKRRNLEGWDILASNMGGITNQGNMIQYQERLQTEVDRQENRLLELINQDDPSWPDVLKGLNPTGNVRMMRQLIKYLGQDRMIILVKDYLRSAPKKDMLEFTSSVLRDHVIRDLFEDLYNKFFVAGNIEMPEQRKLDVFNTIVSEFYTIFSLEPDKLDGDGPMGEKVINEHPVMEVVEASTIEEFIMLRFIQLPPSATDGHSIGAIAGMYPLTFYITRETLRILKAKGGVAALANLKVHKEFWTSMFHLNLWSGGADRPGIFKLVTESSRHPYQPDIPQPDIFTDRDILILFGRLGLKGQEGVKEYEELIARVYAENGLSGANTHEERFAKLNEFFQNNIWKPYDQKLNEYNESIKKKTDIKSKFDALVQFAKENALKFTKPFLDKSLELTKAKSPYAVAVDQLSKNWRGRLHFWVTRIIYPMVFKNQEFWGMDRIKSIIATSITITGLATGCWMLVGLRLIAPALLTMFFSLTYSKLFLGKVKNKEEKPFWLTVVGLTGLFQFGLIAHHVFWKAAILQLGTFGFATTVGLFALMTIPTLMSFFQLCNTYRSYVNLYNSTWSKTYHSVYGLKSLVRPKPVHWPTVYQQWLLEFIQTERAYGAITPNGEPIQEYFISLFYRLRQLNLIDDQALQDLLAFANDPEHHKLELSPDFIDAHKKIKMAFSALSQKKPSTDTFANLLGTSTNVHTAGEISSHLSEIESRKGSFNKHEDYVEFLIEKYRDDFENSLEFLFNEPNGQARFGKAVAALKKAKGRINFGGIVSKNVAKEDIPFVEKAIGEFFKKHDDRDTNLQGYMARHYRPVYKAALETLLKLPNGMARFSKVIAALESANENTNFMKEIEANTEAQDIYTVTTTLEKFLNEVRPNNQAVIESLARNLVEMHLKVGRERSDLEYVQLVRELSRKYISLEAAYRDLLKQGQSNVFTERYARYKALVLLKYRPTFSEVLIWGKHITQSKDQKTYTWETLKPYLAKIQELDPDFIQRNGIETEKGFQTEKSLVQIAQQILDLREKHYQVVSKWDAGWLEIVSISKIITKTDECDVLLTFYNRDTDSPIKNNKNGGINNNLHLTYARSQNLDALVRVSPGQNMYIMTWATLMGRRPEIVILNPMFIVWTSLGDAFPVTTAYGNAQEVFTSDFQRGRRLLLTFYGKGQVMPQASNSVYSSTGEDSAAYIMALLFNPHLVSTQVDWLGLEWGRPSLYSGSIDATEERYTFNVTGFLNERGQFEIMVDKNIGYDVKLTNLALFMHYLSARIGIVLLLTLPLFSMFSAFAYLSPILFFVGVSSVLMGSNNTGNVLRHLRESGSLIYSVYRTLVDAVKGSPMFIAMQTRFDRGLTLASNSSFSFTSTKKEALLEAPLTVEEHYERGHLTFKPAHTKMDLIVGRSLAGLGMLMLAAGSFFTAKLWMAGAVIPWIYPAAIIVGPIISLLSMMMIASYKKPFPLDGAVGTLAFGLWAASFLVATQYAPLVTFIYAVAATFYLVGRWAYGAYTNDQDELYGFSISNSLGHKGAQVIFFAAVAALMINSSFVVPLVSQLALIIMAFNAPFAFWKLFRTMYWSVRDFIKFLGEFKNKILLGLGIATTAATLGTSTLRDSEGTNDQPINQIPVPVQTTSETLKPKSSIVTDLVSFDGSDTDPELKYQLNMYDASVAKLAGYPGSENVLSLFDNLAGWAHIKGGVPLETSRLTGPIAWWGKAALKDGNMEAVQKALRFIKSVQAEDGSFYMATEGSLSKAKSTEHVWSVLAFLNNVLEKDPGNAEVKEMKSKAREYVNSRYNKELHYFARGGGNDWDFVADTTTWIDLEAIVNGPPTETLFGATQEQRLEEVGRMVGAVENRLGIWVDGRLVGISFSEFSQKRGAISIEWSSQFALLNLKIAKYYEKLGNTEKKMEFYNKYVQMIESLRKLNAKGNFYAVRADGSPWVGFVFQGGWQTSDAPNALINVYLPAAAEGYDPLTDKKFTINVTPQDKAMGASALKSDKDLGGIDLSKTKVKVDSSNGEIQMSFDDPAMLQMLLNSDGLIPVIYEVNLMTPSMIEGFVGLNN